MVLNNHAISVSREKGGHLWPIEPIGKQWPCSEGDRIVIETVTSDLPSVVVAGVELPFKRLSREGSGYRARFELFIDTWAGRTTVLVGDGLHSHSIVLEIDPNPRKQGRNEFDAMLAKLSEISKSLPWGLAPGAIGGRFAPDAPVAVHPAVIETQLPILERLLARLLADPPKTTIRTRDARPLDLARRVDLQTVRWLIGRPALLSAVRGGGGTTATANPRTLIDQPASQISLDHPVTRYVALLLKQIKQRLIETAQSLRSSGFDRRFPEPAADAHAVFLADQVDKAVVRIESLLRSPLFREVRPSPLTDSALRCARSTRYRI